jgi:hypothetical protein
MDNRLNEIRRKIRVFRAEMRGVEAEMRSHIAHDRDCAVAGTRLLAMRKDLALMIEEFTALGGAIPLPTVDERLRENFRPVSRARIVKDPAAEDEGKIAEASPPAAGLNDARKMVRR